MKRQLMPVNIRDVRAISRLGEFIKYFVDDQRNQPANKKYEIEVKLGIFKGNQDVDRLFIDQIKEISLQGPQLLDLPPYINNLQYFFESDVDPMIFDISLHYYEQIAKYNRQKAQKQNQKYNFYIKFRDIYRLEDLNLIDDDIYFDITLKNNKRYQYSVNKQSFEVLIKTGDQQHHRNIVHNKVQMRISAKMEETVEENNIVLSSLIPEIKTFRIKQRKTFSIDKEVEISFTNLLQITGHEKEGFSFLKQKLKEEFNPETLTQTVVNYFFYFFQGSNPDKYTKKREIEFEIVHLKYLQNDDMFLIEEKVKQLLRNVEAINEMPGCIKIELDYALNERQRIYNEMDFKQQQTKLDNQYPQIGGYMTNEIKCFYQKNWIHQIVSEEEELNKNQQQQEKN